MKFQGIDDKILEQLVHLSWVGFNDGEGLCLNVSLGGLQPWFYIINDLAYNCIKID